MNPVLVQGLNDVHTTVGNTHPWLNVCRMKPHTQFSSFSCQPMNWLSHSHYLCFTEKWCCQQATQHFLPLQLVYMSHWALVLGHELANVHVSWTQSKKRMVSHRPQRCAAMIQQEVFKTDFRDQECITGVSTCWKCVKLENRTSVISSGPSVVS